MFAVTGAEGVAELNGRFKWGRRLCLLQCLCGHRHRIGRYGNVAPRTSERFAVVQSSVERRWRNLCVCAVPRGHGVEVPSRYHSFFIQTLYNNYRENKAKKAFKYEIDLTHLNV